MKLIFKTFLTVLLIIALTSCGQGSNQPAELSKEQTPPPAIELDTIPKPALQSDSISAKDAEPDTFLNGAGSTLNK